MILFHNAPNHYILTTILRRVGGVLPQLVLHITILSLVYYKKLRKHIIKPALVVILRLSNIILRTGHHFAKIVNRLPGELRNPQIQLCDKRLRVVF